MAVDLIVFAWARLALAALCVGILMWARWNHERHAAPGAVIGRAPLESPFGLRLRGRSNEGLRLPVIAHPLYWLGLTTGAALAAQAIATLIVAAR